MLFFEADEGGDVRIEKGILVRDAWRIRRVGQAGSHFRNDRTPLSNIGPLTDPHAEHLALHDPHLVRARVRDVAWGHTIEGDDLALFRLKLLFGGEERPSGCTSKSSEI